MQRRDLRGDRETERERETQTADEKRSLVCMELPLMKSVDEDFSSRKNGLSVFAPLRLNIS